MKAALKAIAVGQKRAFCRPGLRETSADEQIERRVEEEDACLVERGEKLARRGGFESATAECEDQVPAVGVLANGFGLKGTKCGFALLRKDFADGFRGAGFDCGVRVKEFPSQVLRQQWADRGFSCPHKAGEHDSTDCSREGHGFPEL